MTICVSHPGKYIALLADVNVERERVAVLSTIFGIYRRNNRMMIENLEASMLRQLCVVCQDHQIKRYKECKDYT